jgi:hypothetical protein
MDPPSWVRYRQSATTAADGRRRPPAVGSAVSLWITLWISLWRTGLGLWVSEVGGACGDGVDNPAASCRDGCGRRSPRPWRGRRDRQRNREPGWAGRPCPVCCSRPCSRRSRGCRGRTGGWRGARRGGDPAVLASGFGLRMVGAWRPDRGPRRLGASWCAREWSTGVHSTEAEFVGDHDDASVTCVRQWGCSGSCLAFPVLGFASGVLAGHSDLWIRGLGRWTSCWGPDRWRPSGVHGT